MKHCMWTCINFNRTKQRSKALHVALSFVVLAPQENDFVFWQECFSAKSYKRLTLNYAVSKDMILL